MATFITTKSPGQTISVRVQSSTGYWTYTGAQGIYSNSVTSQAKANLVVPEDGTFEIYSCSSGNINPSGDITYLELSNNQLTSFDGTGLSELTYLDLANNELTSFNGTDLSSLQSLILNSNSLTSFDGTGLVSLTILFLNNNLNLDTFTVNDMTSLQALTLSNGSLSTIDLSTLSDLNSLSLDGNSLTSFDGTGLSALNNLTLAGNPLTSFIGGDMGQVSGLDFNGWDITTLTSVDISGLSNLRFLDLQDNNQLTPTINNSILSTLVSNGLVFDGGKIPYHFYASGGRTSASTSDYNTLISRGWVLSGLDLVPTGTGKLRVKGTTTGGNGGGGNLTDFISVWDTTLGKDPSIELPLVSSGNYNFSVNWGDGNTDTITAWDQSERIHTYATGGVYTITITGTIEGWSFGVGGGDGEILSSITNIGSLKLGNEGAYFQGCSNLTTIGGVFDLTGTTNMGVMFANCGLLTSVNGIELWDVSNVTSMNDMFNSATLFNQDISGWNTSTVTNMNSMFYNATAFNQPLNSCGVSSVTDMGAMFQGATTFNQSLNSWDTSVVTDMNGMFANATAFDGDISLWDVSSVEDMTSMFGNATAFNQDISGWDTSAVTSMASMFEGTIAFNQDINTNQVAVGMKLYVYWDVSSVTDMNNMFANATSFNQPLNSWDVSSVTDMNCMFGNATSFNQPLNSWDTYAVTDMNNMFAYATAFNQDISGWDTSAVTSMGSMFEGAIAFNQPLNTNGSSWNVSAVTSMASMFEDATSFNQDISGWDVSSVTQMNDFMTGKSTANYDYYDDLLNAWSLFNLPSDVTWGMGSIEYTSAGATARQDIIDNYSWIITDGGELVNEFISVWDTTLGDGNPSIILPLVASGNYNFSVNWGDGNTDTITTYDQAETTHTYAEGGVKTITITGTIDGWSFAFSVFNGVGDCQKLTSITNIGPLKLGNVGLYFQGCSNLTTIGGVFDLAGVTNMDAMFTDCSSLTSVNGIGSWDVSNVTSMSSVFNGATNFNQNIGGWDVSSVTHMVGMFGNATLFNQDISGWDVSSVTGMDGMFLNATSFNQDISSWDVSGILGSSGKARGMVDFMGTDGEPLSFSYYDNLLNTWSLLTLKNNVTWGMGPIEYTSAGAAARASIISNYSWNITDGGLAA